MNAIPYDTPEQEWDAPEESYELPGRPRRRFWGPGTAVVLAVLLGVVGFYVGVRVEKGQLSSSTSTLGTGLGGAAAGAGAGARTGAGSAASAAGRTGGFGRALAGGGAGGANASFGTVSSVNGQHDLPHRVLRQHGQDPAHLGDEDDQERQCLQEVRTPRRHDHRPGTQGIPRHDHRGLRHRQWRPKQCIRRWCCGRRRFRFRRWRRFRFRGRRVEQCQFGCQLALRLRGRRLINT